MTNNVRLSRVYTCNLELQLPRLNFARKVAAIHRFVQKTLAAASAVPPDQHRGDNRTRSAHQTCSQAADAKFNHEL